MAVVGCNTCALFREFVPWRSGTHGPDREWTSNQGGVLVSPGIVAKVLPLLSDGSLTVRVGAGLTVFSDSAGNRLAVRHLDEAYPAYEHIIPAVSKTNLILSVDRVALLSKLKKLPDERVVRFWPCEAGRAVKV